MVQGTPIQWRAWHQHKKLMDTWLFWMMVTTWTQKFYLGYLEKLTVLLLGKMKKSSLYSQICWEIDNSLHFPAWTISYLVLFAHPTFLNIQNLGQMLPSLGSPWSELFFDSERTPSVSSDYLPIRWPAHWGQWTFLVHLFTTSSLPLQLSGIWHMRGAAKSKPH